MKYFCCTIFLFAIFSSCVALAQEVNSKITNGKRIRYKLVYRPRIDNDLRATDYMDLIFDERQSYFESGKKSGVDSLKKTRHYQSASEEAQRQMRYKYYTEFLETVQTIPSKGEIFYTTTVIGNPSVDIQYVEKFSPVWKLSSEKKTIAGMKCAKATTTAYGRDWTAWYSLDIPVPYGPYKFYGLPGVIVKLNDTENDFEYEITQIGNETHDYDIARRFMNVNKMDKHKAIEIKKTEYQRMASGIIEVKLINSDGGERRKYNTSEWEKELEQRAKIKNQIELIPEP